MGVQPQNLGWVENIYAFETTDVVEGGADGVDNLPLKQLASRTKYLFDMFNAVMAPFIGNDGLDSETPGKGWVLFNDIAANIPAGWAEVTEMRGKMPIGLTSSDTQFNAIGNQGGAKQATLSAGNIPQLTVNIPKSSADNGEVGATRAMVSNLLPDGNITVQTGNASPTPVATISPYRVVTYIKWVGL